MFTGFNQVEPEKRDKIGLLYKNGELSHKIKISVRSSVDEHRKYILVLTILKWLNYNYSVVIIGGI